MGPHRRSAVPRSPIEAGAELLVVDRDLAVEDERARRQLNDRQRQRFRRIRSATANSAI